MPISSHCFWPWLRVRRACQPVLEEDHLGDFLDPLAHRGVALESQRAEHRAAARKRNFEIFEDRQIFIDRRGLELAADAGLHDLVLLHPGQFLAAELIEPDVALVLPQIRSSTVVLPAPLGPMMTRISFSST